MHASRLDENYTSVQDKSVSVITKRFLFYKIYPFFHFTFIWIWVIIHVFNNNIELFSVYWITWQYWRDYFTYNKILYWKAVILRVSLFFTLSVLIFMKMALILQEKGSFTLRFLFFWSHYSNLKWPPFIILWGYYSDLHRPLEGRSSNAKQLKLICTNTVVHLESTYFCLRSRSSKCFFDELTVENMFFVGFTKHLIYPIKHIYCY